MFQIIWSPRAKQNYAEILTYLSNISVDAAIKLDGKIDALMKQLTTFQFLCPPSPSNPDHRRCVILKKYSIIYKVRERAKTIHVLSIIDNRVQPAMPLL